MTEISEEVKDMLINDINNSNIEGIKATLDIILEKPDNPNIISVEFTLSQIDYLESWGRKLNGLQVPSIIRMMVDTMMRMNPQLGKD